MDKERFVQLLEAKATPSTRWPGPFWRTTPMWRTPAGDRPARLPAPRPAAERSLVRHLGDADLHQRVPAGARRRPVISLALRVLPESLRLPLTLQYAEGMSYQEIAQVLHLPESTVRGRIAPAKDALRKELAV